MAKMITHTAKEVCVEIASDFKLRGIKRKVAAAQLGYCYSSLNNILSQHKYLSPNQAAKFNKAFGYNINFLTKGEGRLRKNISSVSDQEVEEMMNFELVSSELEILRSYFQRIVNAWGNPIAKKILAAYQGFNKCSDIDSFMSLTGQIEADLRVLESLEPQQEKQTIKESDEIWSSDKVISKLSDIGGRLKESIRANIRILGGTVCMRWYHDEHPEKCLPHTFYETDDNGYGIELFVNQITSNEEGEPVFILNDTENTYESKRDLNDFNTYELLHLLEDIENILRYVSDHEESVVTVYPSL